MRTAKQIQARIRNLQEIDQRTFSNAELNKLRKEVAKLILCRNYLESNPTPEFIRTELEKMTNKYFSALDHIATLTKPDEKGDMWPDKDAIAEYKKDIDWPNIQPQIKALKFLLSDG